MYLVKDPDVAALIHRHSRTLTFIPIVEMQVSGTCGITQEMWDKFNPGGEKDKPISRAIHKIHHANLVPSKIHDMHVRSFGIMTGRLKRDHVGKVALLLCAWKNGCVVSSPWRARAPCTVTRTPSLGTLTWSST